MTAIVIPPWAIKLRGILTKIADFFIAGRAAGAWDKKQGPDIKKK